VIGTSAGGAVAQDLRDLSNLSTIWNPAAVEAIRCAERSWIDGQPDQ
jgi:hypothetical protein